MYRTAFFAATLLLAGAPAAHCQLDPNAFTSLGTLNVSSGTLTINTDTLAMSGAAKFTGVSFNQNNGPQVAVFDFSSITISSGVTVTLTGSRRALALLSQGNATIQPTLTVSTFAGNNIPALGGYAGGYVAAVTDTSDQVRLAQNGGGPGGGGADTNSGTAGGGGYGGNGGFGGLGTGGVPGLVYGNLFQTLQGGGGGGAALVSQGQFSSQGSSGNAQAGAGGGALEVVAAGSLSVAGVTAGGISGTAATTNVFTSAQAGGGAGGGILLRGGTGLTLNGTLDAHGGDGGASGGGAGGGGGGRIALSGLSGYTLGTSPSGTFILNGSNGNGGGTAGFAGVLTVDALTTFVPGGMTVTLAGAPITSIAGSTTQTGATIEAYARRDLNVTGTVILGANNAFQRLDAAGNNVTSLVLSGSGSTFDLNGYSQAVDTFSEFAGSPALVKLPAGSTLTVGVGGASNTYVGQITGAGAFVKAGAGTQTLSGTSPNFTGPTTVTGGQLAVGGNQALQNSTVTLAGGSLVFSLIADPVLGALAGTGNVSLPGGSFGINTFTVGGNNATTTFAGNLSGSTQAGVIKGGTGTWTLSGTNTQTGPFNVQAGTVLIGSAGALAPSNSVSVSTGATLDLNGYGYTVTSGNTLTVQGNLRFGGAGLTVASGATATYSGGFVSNGFLSGSGTQTVTGGATLSGISTANSATLSVTGASSFTNFSNSGAVTLAAGLAATPTVLSNVINQGSGTVTVGAGSAVNAADFQTYGTLTLNPNTMAAPTMLTNTGASPFYFNGGSRTFISQVGHAPQFDAAIDLHGNNAVVAGGLLVNNGFIEDTAGSHQVIADFGSLVKGSGFFQNSVQTINGGKFQSGNSPGAASFGSFTFGPGGVSNYVFAIDDAAGTAGPSPDANGHVSGWGLVKAVQRPVGSVTTPGDFQWTADAAHPLTVHLDTLINPTTVGTDIGGLMADFDPAKPYSWLAASWAGNFAGPADPAALNAATAFDTTGFANPIAGAFAWQFDEPNHTLSLTYTPSAVPEPGTFALAASAAAGLWAGRRRLTLRDCS
jgi:autotransporter-associated beta strand protein